MGSATYKNWGGGGGWGAQVTTDKYTVYTAYRGGARILVRGETSEKISYMNSSQVLYCNGVAKISVRGGGHSTQMYSSKTFEKF